MTEKLFLSQQWAAHPGYELCQLQGQSDDKSIHVLFTQQSHVSENSLS